MPTINLTDFISEQWKEVPLGTSTQAFMAIALVAAISAWSIVIWRARVRIRRRIQAAVAAYTALELSQ